MGILNVFIIYLMIHAALTWLIFTSRMCSLGLLDYIFAAGGGGTKVADVDMN